MRHKDNTIREFLLINSPRREKSTYHSIRMHNVSYNGVFPFSLHEEATTKLNVAIAGFRQAGFDFVVTRPTKFLHLIFFSAGNIENKNKSKLSDTIS